MADSYSSGSTGSAGDDPVRKLRDTTDELKKMQNELQKLIKQQQDAFGRQSQDEIKKTLEKYKELTTDLEKTRKEYEKAQQSSEKLKKTLQEKEKTVTANSKAHKELTEKLIALSAAEDKANGANTRLNSTMGVADTQAAKLIDKLVKLGGSADIMSESLEKANSTLSRLKAEQEQAGKKAEQAGVEYLALSNILDKVSTAASKITDQLQQQTEINRAVEQTQLGLVSAYADTAKSAQLQVERLEQVRNGLELTRRDWMTFQAVLERGLDMGTSIDQTKELQAELQKVYGAQGGMQKLAQYQEVAAKSFQIRQAVQSGNPDQARAAALAAGTGMAGLRAVTSVANAGRTESQYGASTQIYQTLSHLGDDVASKIGNQFKGPFGAALSLLGVVGDKGITTVIALGYIGNTVRQISVQLGAIKDLQGLKNQQEKVDKLSTSQLGSKIESAASATTSSVASGATSTVKSEAERALREAGVPVEQAAEKAVGPGLVEAGALVGGVGIRSSILKMGGGVGKKALNALKSTQGKLAISGLLSAGISYGADKLSEHEEGKGNLKTAASFSLLSSAGKIGGYAATGAEIGSIVPGAGTAIGAAAGALVGALTESGSIVKQVNMLWGDGKKAATAAKNLAKQEEETSKLIANFHDILHNRLEQYKNLAVGNTAGQEIAFEGRRALAGTSQQGANLYGPGYAVQAASFSYQVTAEQQKALTEQHDKAQALYKWQLEHAQTPEQKQIIQGRMSGEKAIYLQATSGLNETQLGNAALPAQAILSHYQAVTSVGIEGTLAHGQRELYAQGLGQSGGITAEGSKDLLYERQRTALRAQAESERALDLARADADRAIAINDQDETQKPEAKAQFRATREAGVNAVTEKYLKDLAQASIVGVQDLSQTREGRQALINQQQAQSAGVITNQIGGGIGLEGINKQLAASTTVRAAQSQNLQSSIDNANNILDWKDIIGVPSDVAEQVRIQRDQLIQQQQMLKTDQSAAQLDALRQGFQAITNSAAQKTAQVQSGAAASSTQLLQQVGANPAAVQQSLNNQARQDAIAAKEARDAYQANKDKLKAEMDKVINDPTASADAKQAAAQTYKQGVAAAGINVNQTAGQAIKSQTDAAMFMGKLEERRADVAKEILDIEIRKQQTLGASWGNIDQLQRRMIQQMAKGVEGARKELQEAAKYGQDSATYQAALTNYTQRQADLQMAVVARQRGYVDQLVSRSFGLEGGSRMQPVDLTDRQMYGSLGGVILNEAGKPGYIQGENGKGAGTIYERSAQRAAELGMRPTIPGQEGYMGPGSVDFSNLPPGPTDLAQMPEITFAPNMNVNVKIDGPEGWSVASVETIIENYNKKHPPLSTP